MKFHPAVPAQHVIEHITGSKNRTMRDMADAERTRRGLNLLKDISMRLRASLQGHPGEIEKLEAGRAALEYRITDLIAAREQVVEMEREFQNECLLWLNRKEPTITVEQISQAASGPIEHVPSVAHEIPTPAAYAQGEAPKGQESVQPPEDKAMGYYAMNDGTRVYVNFRNDPLFYSVEVRQGDRVLRIFTNTKNERIPQPADLPPEIAPNGGTQETSNEAFVQVAPQRGDTPQPPNVPTLEAPPVVTNAPSFEAPPNGVNGG